MALQGYEIEGLVGSGGMGIVYKAWSKQWSHWVALKELAPDSEAMTEAIAAFSNEGSILSSLAHPGMPKFYDQFEDGGRHYLVMEFIEGETLESVLANAPTGRLSVEQVLKYALQLCDVLTYLHNQHPPIIFRDLKPANVMITRDDHLYLIDFGIARFFKPGQAKDTRPLGSWGYAAPEQYNGARGQTTPRTDVYGLGATLHQMLSGVSPALSPRFSFKPLGDDALSSLIASMVETEPIKRPSVPEVYASLLQFYNQAPSEPSRKKRRRRFLWF